MELPIGIERCGTILASSASSPLRSALIGAGGIAMSATLASAPPSRWAARTASITREERRVGVRHRRDGQARRRQFRRQLHARVAARLFRQQRVMAVQHPHGGHIQDQSARPARGRARSRAIALASTSSGNTCNMSKDVTTSNVPSGNGIAAAVACTMPLRPARRPVSEATGRCSRSRRRGRSAEPAHIAARAAAAVQQPRGPAALDGPSSSGVTNRRNPLNQKCRASASAVAASSRS